MYYAEVNNSFELFLKFFDSQVQPIALYGAELWDLETTAVHYEKVFICAEKVFGSWDANAKWPCLLWNK